jgi:hypothetical protein
MMIKTKAVIAAALVAGSISAAFAQSSGDDLSNSNYLRNPAAPVPLFTQTVRPDFALIEGRNVGVATQTRIAPAQPAPASHIESFGGY